MIFERPILTDLFWTTHSLQFREEEDDRLPFSVGEFCF